MKFFGFGFLDFVAPIIGWKCLKMVFKVNCRETNAKVFC